MLTVNFVTTNSHKFAVAENFFRAAGLSDKVTLKQHNIETPEVQADSVEEVALNSAKWVAGELNEPVVVADAGLSIAALKGFPGPYMKYINQTLSPTELLALMDGKSDRSVDFTDALAYFDPDTQTFRVFKSITSGAIATKESEQEGSTVDRLFIPKGYESALADIPEDERRKVWNTDRWQQLTDFLQSSAS